jgi:hypothetical protein
MGGRKLTADELAARAEANGYKRGEHQEEDQLCDNNRHVDKTIKDQDAALNRYIP